jgi:hypothetical protein
MPTPKSDLVCTIERTVNAALSHDGPQLISLAASTTLCLPAAFDAALAEPGYVVRGAFPGRPWPSSGWIITLPAVTGSESLVELSTSIRVSKLAPIFSVLHHYRIPFNHPSAIMPSFKGESGRPFSQAQFSLHEKLAGALGQGGFVELTEGMSLRYVPCNPATPAPLGDACVSVGEILFGDPFGVLEERP